ncbi:hypothetical protein D3C81_1965820 [compost metagenome]
MATSTIARALKADGQRVTRACNAWSSICGTAALSSSACGVQITNKPACAAFKHKSIPVASMVSSPAHCSNSSLLSIRQSSDTAWQLRTVASPNADAVSREAPCQALRTCPLPCNS